MENKRMFLAIAICAGIFLIWQQLYVKPYAEKQERWKQAQILAQPTAAQQPLSEKSAAPSGGAEAAKLYEEKTIALGDGGFRAKIAARGGVILEMTADRGTKVISSDINARIGGKRELEILSPSQEWMYLANVLYSVQSQEAGKLVLVYGDDKVAITRSYVLNSDAYTVDHESVIQFKAPQPNYLFVNISADKNIAKEYGQNEHREASFGAEDGMKHWPLADLNEVKESAGAGNWAGISSRYFMKALVDNGSAMKPQFQARSAGGPANGEEVSISLVYRVMGPAVRLPVRYYYGVKELDALKKVGGKLDLAVDFGMFTVIAYPMLQALKAIHAVVKNFGISIILLTVLIKLLLYPLTYKSVKGMKEMQRIQPQMKRLQEKYKNDKQALNQETLKLMQSNGYNPMSGCLPMVVQMPVFIALYNVLYNAFDLYKQPFFGWITDLSLRDPYFVTPVVLTLLMFLQQKLTPTTASVDPAQQKMMQMMPLVFGAMMAFLPSGLTLYMLVNSLVSIAQQALIMRLLNAKSGAQAPIVVS